MNENTKTPEEEELLRSAQLQKEEEEFLYPGIGHKNSWLVCRLFLYAQLDRKNRAVALYGRRRRRRREPGPRPQYESRRLS